VRMDLPRAPQVLAAGSGKPVPHIYRKGRLTVAVERLAPFSQVVYQLVAGEGSPQAATDMTNRPLEIDNGVFRLKRAARSPNIIDEVYLGSTLLGAVQPLIHQRVEQDVWVKANRVLSVRQLGDESLRLLEFRVAYQPDSEGAVTTRVDERGKYERLRRQPAAYEARYELLIAEGAPCFAVRCVAVKNTDTRPWRLVSYFHYLPSKIAGRTDDDRLGRPDVPNYYGLRTVWFDPRAGFAYAAVVPDSISRSFWLDEAGNQHPDIYRRLERVLKPDEEWSGDEPWIFIFGVKSDEKQRKWNELGRRIARYFDVMSAVYRNGGSE